MTQATTTHEELDARLPVGTVVDGRYQIVGHLGRGGFAHVYRAKHIHLQREVALKILDLPQGPNAAQFQARFLQEARIAARIKHPNVVDVSDFGVPPDLGQAYIAMDLLEGHDLEAELVRNGPLNPTRALRLFDDCLAALAEGHRIGIVHKDLKPTNLFLRYPGTAAERLVILDFGIARVFGDDSTHMTQTGGFAGTPAYLAPEYIERQHVTPALDVYQMGLILIESLTAKPAVMASTSMAYLIAHCQGQVHMPGSLEASPIGAILRRATSLSPNDRYATAADLRQALLELDPNELPVAGSVRMEQGFGNRGRLDAPGAHAETVVNTMTASAANAPNPIVTATPELLPVQATTDESKRLKMILVALLLVIVLGSVVAIALIAGGGQRGTPTDVPIQPSVVEALPGTDPPIPPTVEKQTEQGLPIVEPAQAVQAVQPATAAQVTAAQVVPRVEPRITTTPSVQNQPSERKSKLNQQTTTPTSLPTNQPQQPVLQQQKTATQTVPVEDDPKGERKTRVPMIVP